MSVVECSLKHIFSDCKTSLSQGHYTWRHTFLKSLAWLLVSKRVEVNSLLVSERDSRVYFVREGQKSGNQSTRDSTSLIVLVWGKAGQRAREIASTVYCDCYETRMLYSECECMVCFIQSTIPFKNAIEEAFEWKKLMYMDLVA